MSLASEIQAAVEWATREAGALAGQERYPVHDPVNNALAIVENEQLIAALQGDGQGLGRFLSVRLHRQKRLGRTGAGEMVGYEQTAELAQGLPAYLEMRAGRPLEELFAHLKACNVSGRWADRERFRWTGAAQGLLLDQVAPGWPERLTGEGPSLQGLLLAAAGEIPAVGGVVKAVGFTAVLEREEQAELARRQRMGQD